MGVSTDGILTYGVDFGEDLPKPLMEFMEDTENDYSEYFYEKLGVKYENYDSYEAFSLAKDKVKHDIPCEIVMHCSYDFPMYIISIPGTTANASRGWPEGQGINILAPEPEKIEKMRKWFQKEGWSWVEPQWILASMWS